MRAEWNEPVSAKHGVHPSPTVAAGKLGDTGKVLSSSCPSLGPWSSTLLAPRARVGVSIRGCFKHPFLEQGRIGALQESTPGPSKTPFPQLRKISIFMSLITPLKLLCECSNSKSSTTQRQILRPLGNQQWFLRLPCSVPVLPDWSCVPAPLGPRE